MKKVFLILVGVAFCAASFAEDRDTVSISVNQIQKFITENGKNSKGKPTAKYYAMVNGELASVTKTVMDKVALCKKHGAKCPIAVVRNKKTKSVIVTAFIILGAWIYTNAHRIPEPPQFEDNEFREFEHIRDSLYDYAINIVESIASADNNALKRYNDEEVYEVVTTYRVPSLEYLLIALDHVDEYSEIADAYDDITEEFSLGEYYRLRYRYESYF